MVHLKGFSPTYEYHALKTHLTCINVLTDEVQTYESTNVTHILYIPINSYKFVCQFFFQCTILVREKYELQMNEFCMIFFFKL